MVTKILLMRDSNKKLYWRTIKLTNLTHIKRLAPELIEKIAAGEVVERPASVVKELIENSLDAGATQILISLKNAGVDEINISDNGSGMSSDDVVLAVQPHTTSKISSLADLFAIQTLGFRGEALASVCAVSHVTITTKTHDSIVGSMLVVDGGVAQKVKQIGAPDGTTIVAKDLFYNVPARKKFLKSASTELQAITTIVSNYCLANPAVHFSLVNDGRQIILSPAAKSMIEKIGNIYGAQTARQMICVSLKQIGHDDCAIEGFVSNPSLSRADKKLFTFFLNGRVIRNPALLSAVVEGYKTLLMIGRYPVGALNLIIDPHTVDVNVHPSKDLVKFENESQILSVIRAAVTSALDATNLLREHHVNESHKQQVLPSQTNNAPLSSTSLQQSNAGNFVRNDKQNNTYSNIENNTNRNNFTNIKNNQSDFASNLRESITTYQANSKNTNGITSNSSTQSEMSRENFAAANKTNSNVNIAADNQSVLHSTANEIVVDTNLTLRYIGLLHRTYAICESASGLVMIDFHAAHERYLYEQIKAHRLDSARRTQALLSPLKIELSPAQLLIVNENQSLLESLGFIVDEFGGSTILFRSVPLLFHKQMDKQILFDVIDELSESDGVSTKIDDKLDKIMIRMSCRAADKAGDELSDEKIKQIIRQVSTAGHKYSCPHGRPIFLSVSWVELEKMFKRRV